MMLKWMRAAVVSAMLLGLGGVGCGSNPEPSTPKPPPPAPPVPPDKQKPVSLESLKVDEIVAKIGHHKGKIVVVDTWATWCPPCVAEFPELVELHERHAKDGVVCMSVSVDKETASDKALEFLKKKNAAFANYRVDFEAWADKWNIGAIPVVLVFDQEGKLARKFDKDDPDKQFTYKDVEKLVQELTVKK